MIDIGEWASWAQECHLYGQGIINEISPETIEKLREIGSDVPSLTREEIRERSEFNADWLSQGDEDEDTGEWEIEGEEENI